MLKFKGVNESYWDEVSTHPIFNTCCIKCRSNCHLNCNEISVKGEKNCLTMIDGKCKICSHKFDQHIRLQSKFVKSTRNKLVLDETMARKLKTKNDLIENKKSIIESIEKKNLELDLEIQNMKVNIMHLLEDLKGICSDFNYVKELLLTKSLLDSRIDYLQGKFSKSKKTSDMEEIESAIKSKLIIGQLVQIMVDKTGANAAKIDDDGDNCNDDSFLDMDTDDEEEDECSDENICDF